MQRSVLGLGIFLAAGLAHGAEAPREVSSGAAQREAVAVTVYNDDLALVKERRRVELPAGLTRLSLRDVAAQLRPETALLRALSGPALGLIEQNFDFDLLTPQKLLEKYVGREVTVIRPHPTSDAERRETATVLAAGQGTILRFADRIETGVPGRLAFAAVPPNLRDRPTLSVLLEAAGGKQATQEALLDYHLYSFERPTGIADNQTKQLALLAASAVPVRREYLLAGNDWYYRDRQGQIGQKLKPAIFLEFHNQGGQLGKPLPAGIVRVYARDSKGAAQFVGEDRIGHTAKNEKLKLRLGEAFDITAERRQTSYRRIADNVSESAWRIELRNAKDDAVTVRVQEPLPGDWEMLQQSHPHSKESARVAAWNVAVPAGGTTLLEYTVRVKW